MITIKLTSADLHEVVRILRVKAHEDRDRMVLLLNAKPHSSNIALADAFEDQATAIEELADRLEPVEVDIEAAAKALQKAMADHDVSDMDSYDWEELAPGQGVWRGEGQDRFKALAKIVLQA